MKIKHQLVKQYCEARLEETVLEDQLNKAFQRINCDNYIVGLQTPKTSELLEALMEHVAGKQLMDWVYWWIYEADHGTKHFDFTVDGREYTASELTLEQFLEIVDAGN